MNLIVYLDFCYIHHILTLLSDYKMSCITNSGIIAHKAFYVQYKMILILVYLVIGIFLKCCQSIKKMLSSLNGCRVMVNKTIIDMVICSEY